LMEFLSRGLFVVASAVLMALAAALIGYSLYQVLAGLGSPGHDLPAALLDTIGYVIIAIAVFDVAKYLLEEEVLRGRELRHAARHLDPRRLQRERATKVALRDDLVSEIRVRDRAAPECGRTVRGKAHRAIERTRRIVWSPHTEQRVAESFPGKRMRRK